MYQVSEVSHDFLNIAHNLQMLYLNLSLRDEDG
jgi:hypothetical protein